MKFPSLKKAFLIHFGISLIVFIVLAAIMRLVWYPGDLFWMDGGWQGMQLIAPIDLVLGPALTLCFYRPWKKNIKFDMAAIAAVQIAALSYGVYAAYQQRPAAIVFAENRFETLSLSEYKAATLELTENDIEAKSLRDLAPRMPAVIYAKSFDGEEYGNYLADILNGLPELRERSDRYQSIADSRDQIAKYRLETEETGTSIATSKDAGETIEVPASSPDVRSKEEATVANQPEIYTLKARYEDGTIEFDPDSFEWIKISREIND